MKILISFAMLVALGLPACSDDGASGGGDSDSDSDADTDSDTDTSECVFAAVESWEATTAMPAALESLGVAAHGGYVFTLGGWGSAGATSAVRSAPVESAGGLGAWSSTTPLPESLEHNVAVTRGNRIYVLGGDNGVSGQDEVYLADVSDGEVGDWAETTPLPALLAWLSAAAHGDWIYALGGVIGFTTAQSTVYRGAVDGSGQITAWEADQSLPEPRFAGAAFVAGGELYFVGGASSMSSAHDDVWRASIAGDGTLGAWEPVEPLPVSAMALGAIRAGDVMLLTGGVDFSSAADDVRSMDLTAADTWTTEAALPADRFGHGFVRSGDFAFVLGGWSNWISSPSGLVATVYSARVCD